MKNILKDQIEPELFEGDSYKAISIIFKCIASKLRKKNVKKVLAWNFSYFMKYLDSNVI